MEISSIIYVCSSCFSVQIAGTAAGPQRDQKILFAFLVKSCHRQFDEARQLGMKIYLPQCLWCMTFDLIIVAATSSIVDEIQDKSLLQKESGAIVSALKSAMW